MTGDAPPHDRSVPGRTLWLVLLAGYGGWVLATPDAWHLPDFLNLPIHETGHLVFAWAGQVGMVLGGTIFQLALPLAIAASFARRGDGLGVATGLWWVGQNVVNVARYVADAPTQALPLVGGGEHDWAFLLAEWGRLHQAADVARALRFLAALVIGLAIWHGWRTLRVPPAGPNGPSARSGVD